MSYVQFSSAGFQQPHKKAAERETHPDLTAYQPVPAFGGKAKAENFKAAFMPRFGASGTTEAAVRRLLNKLDMKDMAVILDQARTEAKTRGHAEVTPLHVMAVQFTDMLAETRGKRNGQKVQHIERMVEDGQNLWAAVLGVFINMQTPGELEYHLETALGKVEKALKDLPASGQPVKKPPLSPSLLGILHETGDELLKNQPSPEDVREIIDEQVDMILQQSNPQGYQIKIGLEKQIESADKSLAEFEKTASRLDRLYDEVPELEDAFLQYKQAEQIVKKLSSGRVDPLEMAQWTQTVLEPYIQPMIQEAIQKGTQQVNIAQFLPKVVQQLQEQLPGLKQRYIELLRQHQEKAATILGDAEPLPPEAEAAYVGILGAQRTIDKMFGQIYENVGKQYGEQRAEHVYKEIMTAAYSGDVSPKHLEDASTARATTIYSDMLGLLSNGMASKSRDPEKYLKLARRNGASEQQQATLVQYLNIMKQIQRSLMMKSRQGAGGAQQGEDADDSATSTMAQAQALKQITQFVDAYSQIKWNEVNRKKIDIGKVKREILDPNLIIPTPIKDQIVNFLKTGNRNGWQNQPLLLLVGGGGTDIVKEEVVKTLNKILGMPIHQPTGEVSSMLMLGSGGRTFRGEPVLSPPAKAILKNKTPQSIVYIDNLLRFNMSGGQKMFDDFASRLGRQTFEEPDFKVPFDLSPFVFVAGLEDGYSGEYLSLLHGDRFNDDDMTIINLGVNIDTFTKEKVAQKLAKEIEAKYNVRFEDEAIKTICRDYAIYSRFDPVQHTLEKAAQRAAAKNTGEGPVTIKADELETRWLGPKVTRQTHHMLSKPTVGSVNGLAAGGAGAGFVLRVGISKAGEWHFVPHRDKARYHVNATLGPVTKMTDDSAKKAIETMLADVLNNSLDDMQNEYKLLKGLRHKAMAFNVVFPENVDGPSAGAAIATAGISAVTGIPVRQDVAMTGTYQDKGGVGPIGGILEKTKEAYQAGVKTILMPEMNWIELKFEHPRFYNKLESEGIELLPVKSLDEVLRHALTDYDALLKEPTAEQLTLDEYDPLGKIKEAQKSQEGLTPEGIREMITSVVRELQGQQDQKFATMLEGVLGKFLSKNG